jgi:coenzyme F420-reducing hydrogenase alpha subunit
MKCVCCNEDARWERVTQFAGEHPYCDLHALMEEDFGEADSYSYWSEVKEMEKKLYLVETVSMFRMRYVIEAREASHAEDEFVMEIGKESFKEFSQHHMDEVIVSTRELSATDYMNLFDTDNDYLKSWPIDKKMEFINTIDYKE